MQKYCIVPQKTNKFWLLVKDMELTQEARSLFQRCYIKHVEISSDKTWEIVLATQELIESTARRSRFDRMFLRCGVRSLRR